MKARCLALLSAVLVAGCASRPTGSAAGLSKDVVNQTVKSHRAEIRACYDAVHRANGAARGVVVVSFRVETSGVVTALAVTQDTLRDPGFVRCLFDRFVTWQFPKAGVVTDIPAYPFYLNPVAK